LKAEPAEPAERLRYREQAAFYRAALLLGLIRGDVVVGWADAALGHDNAPAAFIEISTTDPGDITTLRHALLQLGDEKESDEVVRGLLALVHSDLTSGKRSYNDTKLVLRQMRSFLKLPPAIDDQIKTFMVESYAAKPEDAATVEIRVRAWLASHAGADDLLLHS
jgi:hypothetical protein